MNLGVPQVVMNMEEYLLAVFMDALESCHHTVVTCNVPVMTHHRPVDLKILCKTLLAYSCNVQINMESKMGCYFPKGWVKWWALACKGIVAVKVIFSNRTEHNNSTG